MERKTRRLVVDVLNLNWSLEIWEHRSVGSWIYESGFQERGLNYRYKYGSHKNVDAIYSHMTE